MTDDSLFMILRRVVLTALLVGVLGGLVYSAVSWLADVDGAQSGIAILLALPLAALIVSQLAIGLRTGILPLGREPILREKQPRLFWFAVSFEGVVIALLVCIAFWSATHFF